jgi:uncharacterized membrane protein
MKTSLRLLFMPAILIFCSLAYAAPGSLLWGYYYDREGHGDDVAKAVAVKGNRVFVAGYTETSAGGNGFTVGALSAKDGSPLWGYAYDREGHWDDQATAIAVQGNSVFVAGHTSTKAGGYAFTVAALSAKDGRYLWGDFYDREGTGFDGAYAIAVKGNRVFVAGYTTTSAGGEAFTVRAYSAKDGSLLWKDYYDREGNGDDLALAIAVKGNTVFVAGQTTTSAGGPAFTVRAYSANDGSLLWKDYYDREGNGDDWATAIAVQGNSVFVAGHTSTAAGGGAFTVRAYSAKDGSPLWGYAYDREGNGDDAALAIAVKGSTVFVAGRTYTSAGSNAFTVGGLSAKDGSLLWGYDFDREGNGDDLALAIAVKGSTVFVAGRTYTSAGSNAFTVGGLSAKDGSLLWGDYYDREGNGLDVATAITVQGNSVFVAGATSTLIGGYAFTVRAYSAN